MGQRRADARHPAPFLLSSRGFKDFPSLVDQLPRVLIRTQTVGPDQHGFELREFRELTHLPCFDLHARVLLWIKEARHDGHTGLKVHFTSGNDHGNAPCNRCARIVAGGDKDRQSDQLAEQLPTRAKPRLT